MILQCSAARCTERPSSRVAPTAQPIINIPGHYPPSETYAVFNCEWSSSFSSSSSSSSFVFLLRLLLLPSSPSARSSFFLAPNSCVTPDFRVYSRSVSLRREHRAIELPSSSLIANGAERWNVESPWRRSSSSPARSVRSTIV